ncbi:MAG: chemotaxis protein CheB [Ignavibacteria bacterium]|jgi:chemotaxis response regulator CheB|nr:chemotaxis protein CheB [Ignavibacteria bacterium]
MDSINIDIAGVNRILIVMDEIRPYVEMEKVLKPGVGVTDRVKFGPEALAQMTVQKYDVVIIRTSVLNLLCKVPFVEQIQEHCFFVPNIILLVDKSEMEHEHIQYLLQRSHIYTALAYPFTSQKEWEMFVIEVKSAIKASKLEHSKKKREVIHPPFPAVGLAISTGGPKTIYDVFSRLPKDFYPPIFMVQHGPIWILNDYVEKVKERYGLNIQIAKNGQMVAPKTIYIAPDGLNMVIDKSLYTIRLIDSERECFVKPSADPMFRSIARCYGQFCVAVVMTGLGGDGSKGCMHIQSVGGTILVEDPKTAIAPSMPRTLIETVKNHTIYNSKDIAAAMVANANNLHDKLKLASKIYVPK